MKPEDQSVTEGFLFTDQYQLTMAQLYYRQGLHEKTVQFDHFFRDYPVYDGHQTGYCISAGLESLLDWMGHTRATDKDIELLKSQKSGTGEQLFADDFLTWLREEGSFDAISIRAVPEGRVVHPFVPLTIVQGPLAMAQILESSLLNHLNFETLIASKAARIHDSAQARLVLEFGLRRAQGRGAVAGTRAAIIGGADFSSNVGTSHILGLPPKGTHAHSMVQVFLAMGMSELDAFRAYAELYPDDCILLVDTIDSIESGIPNAIRVFEELRREGHQPLGIRLDSGDLAYLSIQAAKMLNQAGFPDATIVLSNNLDELVVWQVLTQITGEAPRYGLEADQVINRLAFGVGTRLITSWGEPALGGVYKLVAIMRGDHWAPAIKISETPSKTPNPGNKHAWRLYDQRGKATADLLTLHDEDPRNVPIVELRHPYDPIKKRVLRHEEIQEAEPLLVDVLDEGRLIYSLPSIEEIRRQRKMDLDRLDPGVRRLVNPHIYHVSISQQLWDLKHNLIRELARRQV